MARESIFRPKKGQDSNRTSPWIRTDRMRGRVLAGAGGALLAATVLWTVGQVHDHGSIEFGEIDQGYTVQLIWNPSDQPTAR